MKMAKASEADLNMAMDLANVLGDIERGYFPAKFSEDPESEISERIDTDNRDQYDRLFDGLQLLLNTGSIFRVIFGMAVICDPANECIDPDADTIEHHPKRQQLENQRDELLAVLEKFAAWNKRYPSHRIYNESSIRSIAKELDQIAAEAEAAIASVKGGA